MSGVNAALLRSSDEDAAALGSNQRVLTLQEITQNWLTVTEKYVPIGFSPSAKRLELALKQISFKKKLGSAVLQAYLDLSRPEGFQEIHTMAGKGASVYAEGSGEALSCFFILDTHASDIRQKLEKQLVLGKGTLFIHTGTELLLSCLSEGVNCFLITSDEASRSASEVTIRCCGKEHGFPVICTFHLGEHPKIYMHLVKKDSAEVVYKQWSAENKDTYFRQKKCLVAADRFFSIYSDGLQHISCDMPRPQMHVFPSKEQKAEQISLENLDKIFFVGLEGTRKQPMLLQESVPMLGLCFWDCSDATVNFAEILTKVKKSAKYAEVVPGPHYLLRCINARVNTFIFTTLVQCVVDKIVLKCSCSEPSGFDVKANFVFNFEGLEPVYGYLIRKDDRLSKLDAINILDTNF